MAKLRIFLLFKKWAWWIFSYAHSNERFLCTRRFLTIHNWARTSIVNIIHSHTHIHVRQSPVVVFLFALNLTEIYFCHLELNETWNVTVAILGYSAEVYKKIKETKRNEKKSKTYKHNNKINNNTLLNVNAYRH